MLSSFLSVSVLLSLPLCPAIQIRLPVNYTALTGDLEVHVQNLTPHDEPYYIQLLEYYMPDNSFTIISSTLLWRDNTSRAAERKIYRANFTADTILELTNNNQQLV
jgi:hypothetical protein